MSQYFTRDLIVHLIAFQALLLLIVLSNGHVLSRATRHSPPPSWPRVSILVPARDEEGQIARCVGSLLAQDYDDFEVLVFDDQSSDSTRTILESIACLDSRLKVLSGTLPPAGWLGKNWACAQLAEKAEGHLLYFTDADTFHQPQALRAAVTALEGERADLLTGFPQQIVRTWGEQLLVPFFSWAFYCFTPLWLAYRVKLPALSCAVGQMLLFRKAAYRSIGGHGAVRGTIVEDLDLARRIKAAGYRWRMFDAARLVSCRMYQTGQAALSGLSKNLFAAFEFRLLPFLFIWLWLMVMFLEPPLVLGLAALRLIAAVPSGPILWCLVLSLLIWWIPYWRLRLPAHLAFLYPLILCATEWAAWRSVLLTVSGRLTWKGRTLARPRWKWL